MGGQRYLVYTCKLSSRVLAPDPRDILPPGGSRPKERLAGFDGSAGGNEIV